MSKNGFLTRADPPLFEADLYIAAMGRSGSTALANLLTSPPARWVLTEPWFVQGAVSKLIRDRAASFNWPTDDAHWQLLPAKRNRDGYLQRYTSFLSPRLRSLERWGVKEVRGDFHLPTIDTIRPKNIVVLVRNIRDVVLSLLEKQIRQGSGPERGEAWISSYCSDAANSLLGLARASAPRTRIIRFEDFMGSDAEHAALAAWLDWPLNGDSQFGLAAYGRGYEIARQQGGETRLLPENASEIADRVADELKSYQDQFGY